MPIRGRWEYIGRFSVPKPVSMGIVRTCTIACLPLSEARALNDKRKLVRLSLTHSKAPARQRRLGGMMPTSSPVPLVVSQGESLLHVSGGAAVQSWAGSLERFLAEFSHGRGLGVLHPNLDGQVSFARQVPSGSGCEEGVGDEGDVLVQTEGASTPTPTLRGAEECDRPPEMLLRAFKSALLATVGRCCLCIMSVISRVCLCSASVVEMPKKCLFDKAPRF